MDGTDRWCHSPVESCHPGHSAANQSRGNLGLPRRSRCEPGSSNPQANYRYIVLNVNLKFVALPARYPAGQDASRSKTLLGHPFLQKERPCFERVGDAPLRSSDEVVTSRRSSHIVPRSMRRSLLVTAAIDELRPTPEMMVRAPLGGRRGCLRGARQNGQREKQDGRQTQLPNRFLHGPPWDKPLLEEPRSVGPTMPRGAGSDKARRSGESPSDSRRRGAPHFSATRAVGFVAPDQGTSRSRISSDRFEPSLAITASRRDA